MLTTGAPCTGGVAAVPVSVPMFPATSVATAVTSDPSATTAAPMVATPVAASTGTWVGSLELHSPVTGSLVNTTSTGVPPVGV